MAKFLFVGLLAGMMLACGPQVSGKSRVDDDAGNLVSADQDTQNWSQADGSQNDPGLEDPDTGTLPPPDEGISGADNGATDEPASTSCTPAPGYHTGQKVMCEDLIKPCVLRWEATSCTWSCGRPPNGLPPLDYSGWDADPAESFAYFGCTLVD